MHMLCIYSGMVCRRYAQMNINEVAKLLNTSIDTLRRWEQKFNLEIKTDSRNRKIFSDEDVKTLRIIKELREQDNGLETITRKLTAINAEDMQKIGNDSAEITTGMQYLCKSDLDEFKNTITERIDNLSEKYSRASYEVGKLQEKCLHYEEKLLLITNGNNKDISALKNELEKVKQENDTLKAELETEKRTPWHKLLSCIIKM
jgi:DNA-binding transcriptional MerR regulator